MSGTRKYLYLVVTDYPFGIGEPFLEAELAEIASKFEKIYIVIPEAHQVNHDLKRFKVPNNAELIEFSITVSFLKKLKSFFKVFTRKFWLERKFVNRYYGYNLKWIHIKMLLGFLAMAEAFEDRFRKLLAIHGHAPAEVSLYTYWFFYPTAALASIKERNNQYRIVTRVHGWDCFFERDANQYLPLRPWVAQTIDGIYAISEKGKSYLQAKLGGHFNNKIVRSYLGIDKLPPPDISVSDSSHLHVVSVAFIDPIKQLDRIIDALALIEDVEINWTHIGNAPDGSDFIMKYADEKLSHKPNIRVAFTGEFSKNQVYTFLREQHPDVLLCTSKSEGLPVSMMEAIGHGIGILSVDVGGVSEIVQNGFNGVLLPSNASAAEISEALMSWSNLSKEKRLQRGINAYQHYIDYFSAEKNYSNFFEEGLNG